MHSGYCNNDDEEFVRLKAEKFQAGGMHFHFANEACELRRWTADESLITVIRAG
tara:strand:+ start:1064 stop:1225 length:162 start_codon:yes stop_codon:yes gene_type:complete